jgi:hypothetical protein
MEHFILYIQHVLHMSSLLTYERFKLLYQIIPDVLYELETMVYKGVYTIDDVENMRYHFEQHIASIFGYEIEDTFLRIRIDL